MSTFWQRLSFAFRSFFKLLFHLQLPDDVARQLCISRAAPAVSRPAMPAKPAPGEAPDGAIQLLSLLQRDGRLIDFLYEDVTPYPDAQLGAAVRSVHQSCRAVLDRYFTLGPIISSEEDQPVTVQSGLDPASIKLIGNVVGEPPFRGVLRHRGWLVTAVNLPSLPGEGRKVIAPAEVEL